MSEFVYAAQVILFPVVLLPIATALFLALFIALNAALLRFYGWVQKRFGK